jgi:homospermidine synthase
MRIREFKNGAAVVFDDGNHNGMISVFVRKPSGDIFDKVRCDDRKSANEYFRAFVAIAKNF